MEIFPTLPRERRSGPRPAPRLERTRPNGTGGSWRDLRPTGEAPAFNGYPASDLYHEV